MEAFVNCLWYEDQKYRPKLAKQRLVCANVENLGSQHNLDLCFSDVTLESYFDMYMTQEIQWKTIKLILIPVFDRGHYSLYVVNFEVNRIDVLDMLNNENVGTTWMDHHGDTGGTLIDRLNTMLQWKSKGALCKFGNFRHTKFECPLMSRSNDCAFLAMKFIKHCTGLTECLRDVINPEKSAELRSEYLYYQLFHPKNQAQLPKEISRYRIDGVPF
ncbi:hypothetical protein QOZ80_4AG0320030 [Eleusine coracana subsp. coracana]|nr:hypothetical protein QOZ80_4AG0320030 [Eleusine coracana subsp. coracana]